MSSLSNWDVNTQPQDELPINIPLMQMKRANKAAIERLGSRWSISHDKYAANWLFKRGYISDLDKEQLFQKIADKKARIRKIQGHSGGWRVW